jgi:hypothetical protein
MGRERDQLTVAAWIYTCFLRRADSRYIDDGSFPSREWVNEHYEGSHGERRGLPVYNLTTVVKTLSQWPCFYMQARP